ncbi:hypothetical protein [Streptomyces sp. 147326]|uniref:hypothetical protein n=1 Tax=Streptomyces sp. 147326 TaxID=3074379 RepID=UPI0038576C6E
MDLKAAWQAWKNHREGGGNEGRDTREGRPSPLEVASVTFAHGGDNIGVYAPVFATAGIGGMT